MARADSAAAKLVAVVAIGGLAAGAIGLHARVTAPAPEHASRAPRVLVDPIAQARVAVDRQLAASPSPRGATSADRRALLDAASRGDVAELERLAGKGVALDGTLEAAASSGSVATVKWLLDHGVLATDAEALAVPPLLLADEHGGVVDLLLARGAHDVPLEKAVAAGAPNAVRRALAKRAVVATPKGGEPLVLVAVRDVTGTKRRAILEALVAAGAPLEGEDAEGTSALGFAAAEAIRDPSSLAVVTWLLAHGAVVSGRTLLVAVRAAEPERAPVLDALLAGKLAETATLAAVAAAAEAGDAALVRKLGARGIAWSALGRNATTPLERAIVDGEPEVVKALLDAREPLAGAFATANPALLTAVTAASGGSEESLAVVRVLLDRGASPNVRGIEGRTPLFAAAQQGDAKLVSLLLAKGARASDPVDGMTPIEAADLAGHEDVVRLLRARGARLSRGT